MWLPQRGSVTRNRHLDEVPTVYTSYTRSIWPAAHCIKGKLEDRAHDHLFCFSEIDSYVINIRPV